MKPRSADPLDHCPPRPMAISKSSTPTLFTFTHLHLLNRLQASLTQASGHQCMLYYIDSLDLRFCHKMVAICGCRPSANTIMAAPKTWMPLPKGMATRSPSTFMRTRQFQTTRRQGKCERTSIRSPVSLASATRSYHSRFHTPLPTHEYTNSQSTILAAALEHIPDHGFSKDALIMGARDMGFLDVSIQLFTRQEMDLVLYWLASRRGILRAKVQNGLFEGKQMSVDEKIKTLVIERLRMNSPIIHRWQDVSQTPESFSLVLNDAKSLSFISRHLRACHY